MKPETTDECNLVGRGYERYASSWNFDESGHRVSPKQNFVGKLSIAGVYRVRDMPLSPVRQIYLRPARSLVSAKSDRKLRKDAAVKHHQCPAALHNMHTQNMKIVR